MGGQGVQWWRDHREADTLLIVVTDGKIAWNAQSGDFDWQQTTCLPTAMQGFDCEEPLYVDICWAKRRGLPRFRDRRFREAMLMLLAAMTGRAKDEIDSEDIRQQRRFKLTAAVAGLLITVLALGGHLRRINRRLAAASSHHEWESRRFAAASLEAPGQNDSIDRAITLGASCQDRRGGERAAQASRQDQRSGNQIDVWDLTRNEFVKLLSKELGYTGTATLNPDGRWFAAPSRSSAPVVIRDLSHADSTEPASSLRAVCSLQEADWICRLCQKNFRGNQRTAVARAGRR